MANLKFYKATAMLLGTIIGAGILGIPFVFAQGGFLTGLLALAIVGGMVILVNLCLGEVTLRTKGNHQLTGYAQRYLGKWGKRAMIFPMLIGPYGALTAYTIGEGQILASMLPGEAWLWSAIFYCIMAYLLYRGIRTIATSELELVIFKLVVFAIVIAMIIGSKNMDYTHLTEFDLTNFFIPYGVILFAFVGAVAVPEMREVLIKNRSIMKKSILIGSFLPFIIYALFAFAVVGVAGKNTTEVANIGLYMIGTFPLLLINIFALFAMGTSFLTLSLALKEMYIFDYNLRKHTSWILTMTVPIVLILIGVHSFIKTIAITGAVAGGLEGILIILMYWKAKKNGNRKPEYRIKFNHVLLSLVILGFTIGALAEIWRVVI